MFSLEDRPFSFREIVGQKGIISEMLERSKTLDFPEVLLFQGETGTGKSTTALIIAALLNCQSPRKDEDGTQHPCGVCPSCVDIIHERWVRDTIFLDGSALGKDSVLELSGTAASMPLYDNAKVIIIDEAQNLASAAAKGATLKLLEKKRRTTHFILCTMVSDALDKALKDRGVPYTFRRPKIEEIAEFLFNLLKKNELLEKVPEEFLTEGLFTLAEAGDGSVRGAVQLLERAIKGSFFTKDQIVMELGIISDAQTVEILEELLSRNPVVLKRFKRLGMKDFFNQSWRLLLQAQEYRLGGGKTEDRGEILSRKLSKHGEAVDQLLDELAPLLQLTYLRDDLIRYQMLRFFRGPKPPILNRATRVPVDPK